MRPWKSLGETVPKDEECLMSLPYQGTEILATVPPFPECCSLVSSQTDRPHHYQASIGLWMELETGTDAEKKGRSSFWDQLSVDAAAQLSAYAIQMQKLVHRDRPVPYQAPLYLFLLDVEGMVSDSRWGCSPIRARLLEDDEWGRLRELGRNTGRGGLKMPTAVSLNEDKHDATS